jgi:hypothetical protein
MLFRNEDAMLEECRVCGTSRYKQNDNYTNRHHKWQIFCIIQNVYVKPTDISNMLPTETTNGFSTSGSLREQFCDSLYNSLWCAICETSTYWLECNSRPSFVMAPFWHTCFHGAPSEFDVVYMPMRLPTMARSGCLLSNI